MLAGIDGSVLPCFAAVSRAFAPTNVNRALWPGTTTYETVGGRSVGSDLGSGVRSVIPIAVPASAALATDRGRPAGSLWKSPNCPSDGRLLRSSTVTGT